MNTEKTSAHRRATRQDAAPPRPRIPKETPAMSMQSLRRALLGAALYALAAALPAAAQSAFPPSRSR